MNNYLARWLLLSWTLIILLASFIPNSSTLSNNSLFRYDKLWHFIMYAPFPILVFSVFKEKKRGFKKELVVLIGLICFGGIIELIQGVFIPGRTCSLKDILANSLGVLTGYITWLISKIKK